MNVRIVTPPACLPVSLEEFRRHLWNIYDGQDSDELLCDLLQGATADVEKRIWRKLITCTLRLEQTWNSRVALPYGGFHSLVAVSLRQEGEWTPLQPADIRLEEDGELTFCRLSAGGDRVRIDWQCGYGDTPEDVPGDLRMAIKQLAAWWYTSRAAAVAEGEVGRMLPVPFGYSSLLAMYRLYS